MVKLTVVTEAVSIPQITLKRCIEFLQAAIGNEIPMDIGQFLAAIENAGNMWEFKIAKYEESLVEGATPVSSDTLIEPHRQFIIAVKQFELFCIVNKLNGWRQFA